MLNRSVNKGVKIFVFFMVLMVPFVSFAADKQHDKGPGYKYNEAESLIFGLSHMDNVDFGHTLKYSFERKGVFGDDFKDRIEMDVSKGEGENNKSVAFHFFSGKHRRPYPPFGFVSANPLLTLYFNKDAWDLARKIKAKGTANFLRNRVVDGISKVKKVETAECSYDGKKHAAKKISFRPFFGNESSHHLVHYALTEYQITISETIPGGVCEITSVVPQHVGGVPDHIAKKIKSAGMIQLGAEIDKVNTLKDVKAPLLTETLKFVGVSKTALAKNAK